jgi:beta-glucosidase
MTSKDTIAGLFVVACAASLTTCAPEPDRSAAGSEKAALREAAPAAPIYRDPRFSPEERAADLVSRLTLAQKASQLNSSRAPAIPELGIRAYGWWNEALHGVAREQTNNQANPPADINTTSYPSPLSLGSTWNPELMYREATLISDEAREVFQDNQLDLNMYSPTVNLGRDPRWGRNDEVYSEDPFLTAAIASQFVNGMEGKDPQGRVLPEGRGFIKLNTTLKHYAANNSEFNRRVGTSDIDDRTLREYYTEQFRRTIAQSHPASIMSAYNRINGVPAPAHVYLMDQLARETFGFGGFFTSDCDAIFEIQRGHHWQPPGFPHPLDEVERHAFALTAGEDLDCNQGFHDTFNYGNTLVDAIARKIPTQVDTINEHDVDVAAVRLFTARIRQGEFDDPTRVPWVVRARAAVPPGTWTNSNANAAITETPERLAQARRSGDETIVLLKNSDAPRKDGSVGKLLPLRVPASGPFRVAVIGWYANPTDMVLGGYSSTQQPAGIAKEVGGYQGIKAAVQARNPGAVVDFLPGVTPSTLAAVDAASVTAAADYDVAIVYVGTDLRHSREDVDRVSLALPGAQADLVSQVAARNPNTIVYIEAVGQVDVAGFEPAVSAILWSSYNGQRKGESLADVLLGVHNPSGHLPVTWYSSIAELPGIGDYAIRPSATSLGRTYMYFQGQVTYPFGHGLSYTTFRYAPLRIEDHPDHRIDANGVLRITAEVTNTGPVAGQDVIQLYVTTPDASPSLERPKKRLRGFQNVALQPHETTEVAFTVKVEDLAFFDQTRGRFAVDNGLYGIQLATSAADRDIQQQALVTVTGALRPVPSVVTVKPQAEGDTAQGIVQRVMFPPGAVIDPQLTVTMNDDTQFGFIERGASRPLPPDARVELRSNRPQVVAVDGRGAIRTVGVGVATITASVELHGVVKSAEFAVLVK